MNPETRDMILKALDMIEDIPSQTAEALRVLQDGESDIKELVRVIEHDPGLTATILHSANSALLGGGGKVASIKDAVVRLGRNRLFQMAVASMAKSVSGKPLSGYGLEAGSLWKHMVSVGVGAEVLAVLLKISPPPSLLAAGILHDIGKVVLGSFIDVDSKKIIHLAFDEKLSFEEAEFKVLGIDHAEVGAELLRLWGLPEELITVVRWHHQPDSLPEPNTTVDLIHAADSLSVISGFGVGVDGSNYSSSETVYSRLGLTTAISENAVCQIMIEMDELSELLGK